MKAFTPKETKDLIENIKSHLDQPRKVLMISRYKGKGRPKKSDYVTCKIRDIQDVKLVDLLECGFTTYYTK